MIDVKSISTHCTRTEFVGTTVLDTIGLVISGIDDTLLKEMNVGMKYHALGLFSSRTGAAGQITAIDDAVKATNTEVLSIEFPRDTKGWGGHGNYIVIGGNDVSDVRHAIELGAAVLEDKQYFEDTVAKIVNTRENAKKRLRELGFTFTDSRTNFIFAKPSKVSAVELFDELKKRNIYVRYFTAPRVNEYLRITIGTDEEMEHFYEAVEEIQGL